MARRAAIQLSEEQWQNIKAKFGFEYVTREQFNTSLRDRRVVVRISKTVEKALDNSGVELNVYRRAVRSIREVGIIQNLRENLKAAKGGDKVAQREATKGLKRMQMALGRMQESDVDYVYTYKGGNARQFIFNVAEGTVQVIDEQYGTSKTYGINETAGFAGVLAQATSKMLRRFRKESLEAIEGEGLVYLGNPSEE